jgi:hypothetical protein
MKRALIGLVLATVLLGSGGVLAQDVLRDSQQLIEQGQFDEALRLLLPEYAAAPTAKLAFTIARAYDAGTEVSYALRFYTKSLHIKTRKGRLSRAEKRRIRQRIRALKKQAAKAPSVETATLSVLANASQALVVLDGRPIGVTPLTGLLVSPGDHVIRVQRDGYGEWVSRFTVGVGQSLQLRAQLPTVSAGVLVQTIPAGANASIKGGPSCVTPCLLPVGAGTFELTVSREGYNTVLHQVRRETGAYSQLPVIRLPKEGGDSQISLLYEEAGAIVLLDGRMVGQTPLATPIPVQAGRHQIAVQRNGYTSWQTTVEIATGQVLVLQVDLQPLYGTSTGGSASSASTLSVENNEESGGAYRTWAWVSMGVGSALFLGGGGLIGHALYNKQQLTGAARMKIDDPKYATKLYVLGITQADAVYFRDLSGVEWIAGIASAGVGLAGVVTGLVLYFLDADPENAVSQSLSVEPMLWPDGSGAMTTIRF